MARITVEDCLDKVDNRFELVMVSSKRARQIQIEGKEPMLPVDNDKPTVLALREIAEGLVDASILKEKRSVDLEEEFANESSLAEAAAEVGEATEESLQQAAEAAAAAEAEAAAEDAEQDED